MQRSLERPNQTYNFIINNKILKKKFHKINFTFFIFIFQVYLYKTLEFNNCFKILFTLFHVLLSSLTYYLNFGKIG